MRPSDKAAFAELLTSVHAFYGKDASTFAISVWWEACKPFDLAAVRDAVNRHATNPDAGQFMPKPADMVKMLQGSTQDGAMVAWAKVDKAIRFVGTYATVVFDDPIIHAVVEDMGGWVLLGTKTDKEWPFIAKEFETRYRGYRMQGGAGEYPPKLTGIAEAQNSNGGFKIPDPVLIGNKGMATIVLLGGSNEPRVGMHRVTGKEIQALPAPKKEHA